MSTLLLQSPKTYRPTQQGARIKWNEFQFLHREPSGIDRAGTVVSASQKAFTLAEVLITLAIIGIVAALTTPTVVRNYQEKQTVVQLKKFYSQINQAFQMAEISDGPISTRGESLEMGAIRKYMRITKSCWRVKDCWYDGPILSLNGKYYLEDKATGFSSSHTLRSADGTCHYYFSYSSNCATAYISKDGKKPLNATCGWIGVDLNCEKKPNIEGRDVFLFWLTKYGAYPFGSQDEGFAAAKIANCSKKASAVSVYGGGNCAAWVLAHENMDYLHKDVAW